MLRIFTVSIVGLFMIAATPARADWCHKAGGGIEECASHPSSWSDCGTAKDGNTIWCYPNGTAQKEASKNKSYLTATLITVGVGVVFIGAMWYFFGKSPSENNPGQVTLMAF
jgi:hypothetical protein